MKSLALWQRLWLLFTVIWVALSLLNLGIMFAAGESQPDKALTLAVLAVAVPAALYLVAWAWDAWRARRR
jgi:hypothetical protein